MMGSTIPPARSKGSNRLDENGIEKNKEMSPTAIDRRGAHNQRLDDLRKSSQSDKSGKSANSEASGQQSDDWSDENFP